jgi:hypothetical protein
MGSPQTYSIRPDHPHESVVQPSNLSTKRSSRKLFSDEQIGDSPKLALLC